MTSSNETYTAVEVADVFWDYLPPAKTGKGCDHRRQTAWGSKTKLGLALTIRRLGLGLRVDLEDRSVHTDEQGPPSS